ncbi:MAG TPA: STAS domain-containing protein [Actinomycetota bacterium]|nr:STAS domain-containing protein [Actinomycetota bacterium]
MDLKIESRTAGRWTVLKLAGEVDVYTCGFLREAIAKVADEKNHFIAVDVQAVEFMDSSGLGVIVGAHKRLKGEEGELVLVSPNKQMRRILALTGLDQILTVRISVDEAIRS